MGKWVNDTRKSLPPHPLTVTKINQTWNLQTVTGVDVQFAGDQSSEEWLATHSLDALKASFKHLLEKAKLKEKSSDIGESLDDVQGTLQFDSNDIVEFEYKLNLCIDLYTKRIKWLLDGSRKMFGVVKGQNVALLMDMSDANCGFGRLAEYQQALLHLIDEQLSRKSTVHLVAFGTDLRTPWQHLRPMNNRTLEDAKLFVSELEALGGCNLMKALRHTFALAELDSVVIVMGSVPDQHGPLLCDYIAQATAGRNLPVHTVAFDSNNHLCNEKNMEIKTIEIETLFFQENNEHFLSLEITLRKMAEHTTGRYHCYTGASDELLYTGTDITDLMDEIKKGQELLKRITEMRQGMLGKALVTIFNEISTEVAKMPPSKLLPRPPGHELPLRLEPTKFQVKTTAEWLRKHGLRAKRLDLYQVLYPNAYSGREEYIPIINKAVKSQIYERVMVPFTWHDGTQRNVHVDMAELFEYQKQLGACVRLYEKRIEWLSSGSRRLFGSISDDRVVFLVDLCEMNSNYLIHIQHSMRLLLEQQVCSKSFFNVIAFNSTIFPWKPNLVAVDERALQDCWNWILETWRCQGPRNVIAALRCVFENDQERERGVFPDGVYLFTSGVPDQPDEAIMEYVETACTGQSSRLHTVLFNVEDYDAKGAIPGRFANITKTAEILRDLAHCCEGGRFLWFRENGIIESDDIRLLQLEIDKAINFSQKCALLVDSIKSKCSHVPRSPSAGPVFGRSAASAIAGRPPPKALQDGASTSTGTGTGPAELRPPKPTVLSMARTSYISDQLKGDQVPKALAIDWPGDGNRSARTYKESSLRRDPLKLVRPTDRPGPAHFYLNNRNNETGHVSSGPPTMQSVRQKILRPILPDDEEQMTTKDWLKRYSISKLRLDLNKLVSGPMCRHVRRPVTALGKEVHAKYCHIFPSINLNGAIRHLQLLPKELNEYQEHMFLVLQRYLRRMQWLLSGSRRTFGCIVERRICMLIDVSGSMQPYLDQLKTELSSLIWEQLHRHGIHFNLICFSDRVQVWNRLPFSADSMLSGTDGSTESRALLAANTKLFEPTDAACHDAVMWTSHLQAHGTTSTLQALRTAFDIVDDVEALYLLSDGKPDSSVSTVLREVAQMNSDLHLRVNTISFNCADKVANDFLRLLAAETGGRYHRVQTGLDVDRLIHRLSSEANTMLVSSAENLSLPEFDGDDLRRLSAEVSAARRFIFQAQGYRQIYDEFNGNRQRERASSAGPRPRTTHGTRS